MENPKGIFKHIYEEGNVRRFGIQPELKEEDFMREPIAPHYYVGSDLYELIDEFFKEELKKNIK